MIQVFWNTVISVVVTVSTSIEMEIIYNVFHT